MARVTVEDCLHDVENLFQLVLVASKRARQVYMGSEAQVPHQGDKPTVVALREIAEGLVGKDILTEKPRHEEILAEVVPAEDGEVPPAAAV